MKKQLSHKDAERALRNLGFTEQPRTATSHVKWIAYVSGQKYVVTLDQHNSPYSRGLLASICRQAGVTKKQMFQAIKTPGHPQGAISGESNPEPE